MATDSSTGGALVPAASPAPLEGDALDNFIQEWIISLTNVAGQNARPRWQEDPPNIPPHGTDWLAFGITDVGADSFAAEVHDGAGGAGLGSTQLRRHEVLEIYTTFYGPNAVDNAKLLRDSAQIAQNHEILDVNGFGFVDTGELTRVPELIKSRWVQRVDITIHLRRQVVREYSVLNIASADGTVDNEHSVDPFNT